MSNEPENVKVEPEYVGYNLNNPVLVKLEERAFEIWKRFDDSRLDFATEKARERLIKPLEHYTSKANAEGYVKMPFSQLMLIFGDYCRCGYEVFSMNIILPKEKIDPL